MIFLCKISTSKERVRKKHTCSPFPSPPGLSKICDDIVERLTLVLVTPIKVIITDDTIRRRCLRARDWIVHHNIGFGSLNEDWDCFLFVINLRYMLEKQPYLYLCIKYHCIFLWQNAFLFWNIDFLTRISWSCNSKSWMLIRNLDNHIFFRKRFLNIIKVGDIKI